jgi:hypothetical protein
MAKLYFKTVPEIDGCEGCCAYLCHGSHDDFLCGKLIGALTGKSGFNCYDKEVIFKFIKRED